MKNGATPSHCVGSLQAARLGGRRGLPGNGRSESERSVMRRLPSSRKPGGRVTAR